MQKLDGRLYKRSLTPREKLFNQRWLFAYKALVKTSWKIDEDDIQSLRLFLWKNLDRISEISNRKKVSENTITERLVQYFLHREILSGKHLIRIPNWIGYKAHKYKELSGLNLTDEELCDRLEVTPRTLASIRCALRTKNIVYGYGDMTNEGEDASEFEDLVLSDNGEQEKNNIKHIDNTYCNVETIKKTLNKLTTNEAQTIVHLYGLLGTKVTKASVLAKEWHVSRTRIYQYKDKAIEKIKKILSKIDGDLKQ